MVLIRAHLSGLTLQNMGLLLLLVTWVYKNKLDSNNQLERFKARLCARGDMQSTELDTYAATLALKVFRLIMALVAYFDLECEQFDFVSTFLNAVLPTLIHLAPPDGIRNGKKVLRLLRALYGLKESGQLWQSELSTTLLALGLKPVPRVECVYSNAQLLVFFFVDDLVL